MTSRGALFTRHDVQLVARLERPRLLSFEAQALDCLRHFLRLVYDRVAEIARPIEVVVHFFEDGRKAHHGFHRWVPVLRIGARKILLRDGGGVPLEPAMRLHDLERIGGGGKQLREQGVGKQGDRRQQVIEFRLRELRRLRLRPWRRRRGGRRGLVGRRRSGGLRERRRRRSDQQARDATNEPPFEPRSKAFALIPVQITDLR